MSKICGLSQFLVVFLVCASGADFGLAAVSGSKHGGNVAVKAAQVQTQPAVQW